MQCGNAKCSHVFEFENNSFPVINDPGYVVFKCPDCGTKAKAFVNDIDFFKNNKDVVAYCEKDDIQSHGDILSVPDGVIRVGEVTPPDVMPEIKSKIWVVDGVDCEENCRQLLTRRNGSFRKKLAALRNGYLADVCGSGSIDRLLIKVLSGTKKGGYCLLGKEVDSEKDFTAEGLTFLGSTDILTEAVTDGVKNRDECRVVLDNMLRRWKLWCREVYFVSPFIGFQYKSDSYDNDAIASWNWLSDVLDLKKTRFITRKTALTRLKDAFSNNEVSYEILKEWDDLNELIKLADSYDGRKKKFKEGNVRIFQKSHSKFYAGVYDDHVEVLMGSYNIHSGEYLENLALKRYSKEDFEKRFLQPFSLELKSGKDQPEVCDNVYDSVAIIEIGKRGQLSYSVLSETQLNALLKPVLA